MMLTTHQRNRLVWITAIVAVVAISVAVILVMLKDNVQFYYAPQEIHSGKAPVNRPIRVGGLVVKGSVMQAADMHIQFTLTDGFNEVNVFYDGILPDLFREGQGIIALGTLIEGNDFHAVQVLAKHDENYMPKEVAQSLKLLHDGS